MLDWTPGPKTSQLSRSPKRGEVADKKVECRDCQGKGYVKRGKFDVNCLSCGGTDETKGRGWYEIDSHTGRKVGSAKDSMSELVALHRRSVRCDGCGGAGVAVWRHDQAGELTNRCLYCDGTGSRFVYPLRLAKLPEDTTPDALTRSLDKREQLYERGSYPELERALAWLEAAAPRRHRAVLHWVIYGEQVELRPYSRDWLDATVDMLAYRMPDPIVVPPEYRPDRVNATRKSSLWWGRTDEHAEQREVRNTAITTAYLGGSSTTSIASTFAVTTRQVQRIVSANSAVPSSPASVADGALDRPRYDAT